MSKAANVGLNPVQYSRAMLSAFASERQPFAYMINTTFGRF